VGIFNIAPGSGKGKTLIDDIEGVFVTEKIVRDGDVEIKYPPSCITHKLRVIQAAEYDTFATKMFIDKVRHADVSKLPGNGWIRSLAYYKTIIFDNPGKLQSGEFFIYGSGYLGKCDPTRLKMIAMQWNAFAIRKSAFILRSHIVMNYAMFAQEPMKMRNAVFSKDSFRRSIPKKLADQLNDQSLFRNFIGFLGSYLSPVSWDHNVVIVDGKEVLKSRLLYTPYNVIGKVWSPVTSDDMIAATLDLDTMFSS